MEPLSHNDIQQMNDWRSLMEDGPVVHNPRVTTHLAQGNTAPETIYPGPVAPNIDAMKNILDSFMDVAGSDMTYIPPEHIAQQRAAIPQQSNIYEMAGEDMSYEEYLAAANGRGYKPYTAPAVSQQPQATNAVLPKPTWTVAQESYMNSKSVQSYKIVLQGTQYPIVEGIFMRECANAICNMLNNGTTMNDSRMLGILSTGIRYTKEVKKAYEQLDIRRTCLEARDYTRAASLDTQLLETKDSAKSIRDQLIEYLNKSGISYK